MFTSGHANVRNDKIYRVRVFRGLETVLLRGKKIYKNIHIHTNTFSIRFSIHSWFGVRSKMLEKWRLRSRNIRVMERSGEGDRGGGSLEVAR